MRQVVMVLLDGLNAATARECMGYMAALTESGQAVGSALPCELPALSRPLYHCLLTGLTPALSGIVHNEYWNPHPTPTIFHRARAAGRITAAAAYFWMSELCNRHPFVPERDRLTDDATLPIGHGLFYCNDDYPDDHVFLDAETLRLRYRPHLLLVHSMGIDAAGHRNGGASPRYRNAARQADMLLARFVPRWLADGAQIVVTSDHGMSPDALHNGDSDAERRVPLWLLGNAVGAPASPPRQTEICGLLAALLGLNAPDLPRCDALPHAAQPDAARKTDQTPAREAAERSVSGEVSSPCPPQTDTDQNT